MSVAGLLYEAAFAVHSQGRDLDLLQSDAENLRRRLAATEQKLSEAEQAYAIAERNLIDVAKELANH